MKSRNVKHMVIEFTKKTNILIIEMVEDLTKTLVPQQVAKENMKDILVLEKTLSTNMKKRVVVEKEIGEKKMILLWLKKRKKVAKMINLKKKLNQLLLWMST